VPYSPTCASVVDAGFVALSCIVVHGRGGTTAGVVEVDEQSDVHGVAPKGAQERDLVWHKVGGNWSLALRRLYQVGGRGLYSHLYQAPLGGGRRQYLVFLTPAGRAGYGHEMDVVDSSGQVALYRFLGQGFVVVVPGGGVVTYVPGSQEQDGPAGAFDQSLIRTVGRRWALVSQQYVPDRDALAQHHGVFVKL
jgi:hypothetical protein